MSARQAKESYLEEPDVGDFLILLSDVISSYKKKVEEEEAGRQYVKKHNEIVLGQISKMAREYTDISKEYQDFIRKANNKDFILKVVGDGVLICLKEKRISYNLFNILFDLATKI
jgi:hypothetical protein